MRCWARASVVGALAGAGVFSSILRMGEPRAEVTRGAEPPLATIARPPGEEAAHLRGRLGIEAFAVAGAMAVPSLRGPVDFDHEVRPLLEGSCWKCHGAEKHKGGLRLDSRVDVLKGGKSGPAAEAGEGAGSLLGQ